MTYLEYLTKLQEGSLSEDEIILIDDEEQKIVGIELSIVNPYGSEHEAYYDTWDDLIDDIKRLRKIYKELN